MLMLDLCCGLKGASQAMVDRGWTVITLDIDPSFNPDIVADLREWQWNGGVVDFIWISPPCIDFARDHLPWITTDTAPDMSIAIAAKRIVDTTPTRYWAIENVVGALKWFEPLFGKPRHMQRPYFLWGHFPPIGKPYLIGHRKKESYSSSERSKRAKIPYAISRAMAIAIESQFVLF